MSIREKHTSEDKSSDRGSFIRRHPILVSLVVFSTVLYWFFGTGILNLPRFHWYSVSAEFLIDGKSVTVRGTIECAKKPWHFWLPAGLHPRGLPYSTSAGAVAKRLDSGAGLIVEPRNTGGVPPCERSYQGPFTEFPENHVPRVYWLDDAANPTRIERYAPEYYKGSNPRVKFTGFSVARLGYGAFSRSQYAGKAYSSLPIQEVPWLGRTDQLFEGWSATIARKELWSKVPAIRDVAASYSQFTTIIHSELPNQFVISAIANLLSRGPSKLPIWGERCAGVDVAECDSFNQIFGAIFQPVHDVVPTPQGLAVPVESAAPGRVTFAPRLRRKVDGYEEMSVTIFDEKITAPRYRFDSLIVFSFRQKAFLKFRSELIRSQMLLAIEK